MDKLELNPKILRLIADIDEFRGQWLLLGKTQPDVLSKLMEISSIESIGSSTRIEGVKLTDSEIDALLSDIDIQSFQSRDEQEVVGYADAVHTIFQSYHEIPFTENYIKQLHQIIMKYSEKDNFHMGEYKKLPNHVGAFDEQGKSIGIIFHTASPFETPQLMNKLITETNLLFEQKVYHPLLIIGYFIIHFLAIHPFQDGNGRLSRILTDLLLLKNNYLFIQYSSLARIIEVNKKKYYAALRKSQQKIRTDNENLTPWIEFFLQCLHEQKNILSNKITEETKFHQLLPLSEKILTAIQDHGKMTNSQIVSLLQANRNTVKLHLKQLTRSGFIRKYGQGKGTYYMVK